MSTERAAGPGEATRRGPWRSRPWAVATFAVVTAAVAAAVAGTLLGGRSYAEVLDSFVPVNATMGLAFAACGLLVAWHRPGNAIGWLLLADGLGHATTAGTASLALYGDDAGWPMPLVRGLATAGAYAWPWSIGFVPAADPAALPRRPSRRAGAAVAGVGDGGDGAAVRAGDGSRAAGADHGAERVSDAAGIPRPGAAVAGDGAARRRGRADRPGRAGDPLPAG
ncbi:hypothetical protein [Nonomuraea rubra]|uniref:hypothetical protein n=1 Tax=Nonomuraea rubra TaxID=46180 RepID=UPI0031E55E88